MHGPDIEIIRPVFIFFSEKVHGTNIKKGVQIKSEPLQYELIYLITYLILIQHDGLVHVLVLLSYQRSD